MCAEMISLDRCALLSDDHIVARHDGKAVTHAQFCADVAASAASLKKLPQQQYALFHESTYPFAVLLFALWHAGKQVWIPGNNRPATADTLLQQDCCLLGDWAGRENNLEEAEPTGLQPLVLSETRLTIFTSGSSGEPKAIAKTLLQLQNEVEVLERQWGELLGRAEVAATVSHQHIYGLLFRLLWPLAAGRCFYSQLFLSPEPMLKAIAKKPACWIASPAQLKRLDEMTAWEDIAALRAIFSSGGLLDAESARRIESESCHKVIEVYGSSETGGIAWRKQSLDSCWTPFDGVSLLIETKGCRLCSPFLSAPGECLLDDVIDLLPDGRFNLMGRRDRIVKVEEKRLSLDELEQTLMQSDWLAQAHCLLLSGRRDRIAAVLVLSEQGKGFLLQRRRSAMIKQLREQLMRRFELVVLPRKWLIVDAVPLTAQGKADNALLRSLLEQDQSKYPQLLLLQMDSPNHAVLEFRVQPELTYFAGHFPGQPILPGVTQLNWAEHYGKLLFAIDRPFLTMEAIKFKKTILPETLITLTLDWKAETGKLYFDMSSSAESHSSGRMVYGEPS